MQSLHHLDEMPVTAKERRLAVAFMQGGLEVSLLQPVFRDNLSFNLHVLYATALQHNLYNICL